jgi:hypothetical protein
MYSSIPEAPPAATTASKAAGEPVDGIECSSSEQTLPSQVGPASGRVTAIYNGQRYLGDPRQIPLTAHAQIQLDVGRPLVAPDVVKFPHGL